MNERKCRGKRKERGFFYFFSEKNASVLSLQNQDSNRIIALDVARGLAVIGMYIQHFALNNFNGFVSGNTMILFMLCSGISYSIMAKSMMTRKIEPAVIRTRILARSIFIDLVGYVLIMLNGQFAVVLPSYAMLFILALLLINCSTKRLFVISFILFIISSPLMIMGLSLFSNTAILYDIAGGPLSAIAWSPVFVVGMIIGRFNLKNKHIAKLLIILGAIITIPIKLIALFILPNVRAVFEVWLAQLYSGTNSQIDAFAAWPLNTIPPQWQMLFVDGPQSGSIFELLIGTGGSLIILGLLCLLSNKIMTIFKPFSNVGRTSLTLYTIQFIIIWILGLIGIDVTSIDIGSIPFADIFIGLLVLVLGCLLAKMPNGPIEYLIKNFENIFIYNEAIDKETFSIKKSEPFVKDN